MENTLISLEDILAPDLEFDLSKKSKELFANSVSLLGFGFDGTACFRKGTRLGPDAVREISDGIEAYSPYLDLSTEDVDFYDLGNLPISDQSESSWKKANEVFSLNFEKVDFKENGIKLVTIGGEHSISFAPITKYLSDFEDLTLIHLDAHADLRDGYLGFSHSHASIIRRSLDHFGPEHQLIQYGIRSGTKEEYQYMREHGTLKASRKEFLDSINAIDSRVPLYLTLDLDYFDPSFFPGTGTPEPGGEDFHSFVSLMKILLTKNLVGCDVVELSPQIDQTGNSSVFAAKVIRELVLVLSKDRK